MSIVKCWILLALVSALAQAQFAGGVPLTYQYSNTPYLGPSTQTWLVWYGPWTDTTTQAAVVDYVQNSLSLTPNVSIANIYPVGPQKKVFTGGSFVFAGQVSVPYSSTYSGGVNNQFVQGAGGEQALAGALINAGTIPNPTLDGQGRSNTFIVILLAPGITTNTSGACAYSDWASLSYGLSVILDQTTSATSCPYGPFNNKVSGTITSDEIIQGLTLESVQVIGAHSWTYSTRSISELCTANAATPSTAPTSWCSGTGVCQYTVMLNTSVGARYYYLPQTYVNMPPGSSFGACASSYLPSQSGFAVIAEKGIRP